MRWPMLSGLLALAALATPACAQVAMAPTPRVVIYPGQIIRDAALADALVDPADAELDAIARQRSAVVGKMARRTLLPGKPIALAAIGNPRLVNNGSEVTLVYADAGLQITAAGQALQDGAFGDLVRARNSDSGVTVSGVVQADGSIRIGGG
jgi:flagellar basal body P-ring formation protein FlgA